ncbi:MAG: 4-alpha-glucanotransferase [Nitrospirota bacterium]
MGFFDRLDYIINELASLSGIITEYYDNWGELRITPLETKKAILKSMGFKIETIENIQKEVNEIRARPWNRFVEPVKIVSVNNQPPTISLYIPLPEGDERVISVEWEIKDETGQSREYILKGDAINPVDFKIIDEKRYVRIEIPNETDRDIGYYTFRFTCKTPEGKQSGVMQLIVTPDGCYIPLELQQGKRTWGLSVNLYAIRSSQNWGIGDFSDLENIVQWVAKNLKGSFVGINPLHTIPNQKPYGICPYAPVSRHYRNFIYIDIEKIPEIADSSEALSLLRSSSFMEELRNLREVHLIDYGRVASLKRKMLESAFSIFYEKHYKLRSQRGLEFERYRRKEGTALESFTIFMALWEYLRKKMPEVHSWQDWPEEYHNFSGTAVQRFKEENSERVLFHQYIQWIIDEQLHVVAETAKNLGMSVGLYHDLAIGSIKGGSDTWSYPNVFTSGMSVGAPPDAFNLNGQNWGFPPLIPGKLRESGYEFFIQTIRENIKHGGALRIDHALGLFRVFWIPEGMSPQDGTYVRYPSEDLLRIIALESVRNRTIIVAEDLGTIGEEVRETLSRFNMFSYRLFYFERDYSKGELIIPDGYPEIALTSVTTHDLPTLYGYWIGRDIEIKKQLGLYPDDGAWQKDLNERKRDKAIILSALHSQGILPENLPLDPEMVSEMTPELCLAVYTYLARTPCKMVTVSLDDLFGVLNQQNMPGTIDTYPNWSLKIPLELQALISDWRAKAMADMFYRERRD